MFDEFYGLHGRPFQLTPDPAFYFESLTHRKALSYLSYGLAQGEGFITVTGEIGAGKSTLVAYLLATIDRQRLTAAQIVTGHFDGDGMVQAVALAFGLPVQPAGADPAGDKAAVLNMIEAFLQNEARAGRRCLLVVDEVQTLSVEALDELRMLSNFQLGSHPLLQILLLGQPEFRDRLHHDPRLEQLRQRVIAAHHLEAMQPDEVEPYMLHRLKLVGWAGHPGFDPDVFTGLYEATGGVPRRINQVASRLLLLGAIERRPRIDGAMLAQVLHELATDSGALSDLDLEEEHPQGQPAAGPPAEGHAPQAGDVLAALAQRDARIDAQIAALQQVVMGLTHGAGAVAEEARMSATVEERLTRIENRLVEQERTLRHTLTMLIEWVEQSAGRHAA